MMSHHEETQPEETIEEVIRRGTIPCPRCGGILLVDTKGDVTQCYNCGDEAFLFWNLFYHSTTGPKVKENSNERQRAGSISQISD